MFGISGVAYLFCLPRLPIHFTWAALAVFSLGFASLSCTGCTDPGIVPRYKKKKVGSIVYIVHTHLPSLPTTSPHRIASIALIGRELAVVRKDAVLPATRQHVLR